MKKNYSIHEISPHLRGKLKGAKLIAVLHVGAKIDTSGSPFKIDFQDARPPDYTFNCSGRVIAHWNSDVPVEVVL